MNVSLNIIFVLEMLKCKYCKEIIFSYDDVPKHECFLNKNVYVTDDNTLYTEEDPDIVNNVETEAEYLDQPKTNKLRKK